MRDNDVCVCDMFGGGGNVLVFVYACDVCCFGTCVLVCVTDYVCGCVCVCDCDVSVCESWFVWVCV